MSFLSCSRDAASALCSVAGKVGAHEVAAEVRLLSERSVWWGSDPPAPGRSARTLWCSEYTLLQHHAHSSSKNPYEHRCLIKDPTCGWQLGIRILKLDHPTHAHAFNEKHKPDTSPLSLFLPLSEEGVSLDTVAIILWLCAFWLRDDPGSSGLNPLHSFFLKKMLPNTTVVYISA